MRVVKLSAITRKAAFQIDTYGEHWKVMDERRDKQHFKSKSPHLYVIPFNPTTPRNLGAKWIAVYNDPDYDVADVDAPRIKRPS